MLRQLVNLPVLDLDGLSQNSGQVALLVTPDVILEQHLRPLLLAIFTIVGQEDTHVSDETSTDDNITNNALIVNPLSSEIVFPRDLLISKTDNQSLSNRE